VLGVRRGGEILVWRCFICCRKDWQRQYLKYVLALASPGVWVHVDRVWRFLMIIPEVRIAV